MNVYLRACSFLSLAASVFLTVAPAAAAVPQPFPRATPESQGVPSEAVLDLVERHQLYSARRRSSTSSSTAAATPCPSGPNASSSSAIATQRTSKLVRIRQNGAGARRTWSCLSP